MSNFPSPVFLRSFLNSVNEQNRKNKEDQDQHDIEADSPTCGVFDRLDTSLFDCLCGICRVCGVFLCDEAFRVYLKRIEGGGQWNISCCSCTSLQLEKLSKSWERYTFVFVTAHESFHSDWLLVFDRRTSWQATVFALNILQVIVLKHRDRSSTNAWWLDSGRLSKLVLVSLDCVVVPETSLTCSLSADGRHS